MPSDGQEERKLQIFVAFCHLTSYRLPLPQQRKLLESSKQESLCCFPFEISIE